MADHNKPAVTDPYADFLNSIVARIVDSIVMLDPAFTTAIDLPNGAIRWNSTNKYFEQYNGTTWAQLPISSSLLSSPAFTGLPTAPTPALNNNSTLIGTTAYYMNQVSTILPVINGTATIGTSFLWARGDHIHPTDTSRAPLNSPTFTGIPAVPTASPNTNTTQAANTAFVQAAIAALVASSPAALDTLNELAIALGDDPNFATTMTNALALKAPLNSPALTGSPTAPTPTGTYSGNAIATMDSLTKATNNLLPKNSQTFTSSGTFTVPTGITSIMVVGSHAGAGGGGGGGAVSGNGGDGGGGASSVYAYAKILKVTPAQTISITLGAGGAGGGGGAGGASGGGGAAGGAGGTTNIGTFNLNFLGSTAGGGGGGGGAGAGGAGGGGGGTYGGAGGGGGASGGAGGGASGGIFGYSTQATGGLVSSGGGGTGGTSDCNNGSNGNSNSGTTGGAGGAGGSGKVIIYW